MVRRDLRVAAVSALVSALSLSLLVAPASKAVAAKDPHLTLTSIADTYLTSRSAGDSFGDSERIQVSRSAFRGLVRFDTSSVPAGSTVTSAVLRLYSLESPPSGQLEVHPASNDWSEATSWDDQPVWDSSVLASSDNTPAKDTWESIALPVSAVQGTEVSWRVSYSRGRTLVDLASREDPDHAPQLIVTYTTTQDPPPPPPTTPPPDGDIVLGAVGDTNGGGNRSTTSASGLTASSLREANLRAWVHLGDHQYPYGDCNALVNDFDHAGWGAVWGKALNVSGPTHDWSSASDLANVTNHQAGTCSGQTSGRSLDDTLTGRSLGPDSNYVVDLGAWRVVSLSSGLWRYDPSKANAATTWLDTTLADAAAAGDHVVVAWHEPYWTSTTEEHGPTTAVKPWLDLLDKYDVRLLLNGHQHGYARFNPQLANGTRDDATGTQEFIVGTGGIGAYGWKSTAENVTTQQTGTYGWLKLTLHANGHYDWQFVRTSGGTFTDRGTR